MKQETKSTNPGPIGKISGITDFSEYFDQPKQRAWKREYQRTKKGDSSKAASSKDKQKKQKLSPILRTIPKKY